MRHSMGALSLALALAVAPASAQEGLAANSGDIVVTGVRLEEMAQRFVSEVSAAPRADDQVARWNDRICPAAVGLAQPAAQLLLDRIAMRAQAVGLRPGAPGCRANVMVIYAPDSDALSRQIVGQRRDLLGYYGDEGAVTAGRDALEAFASTPRPVRWWHMAQTTTADGPGARQRRVASRRLPSRGAGRGAGGARWRRRQ